MSWKTLVELLSPPPRDGMLDDIVRADPAIYWYVESAKDFTAAFLDMPNNPTGRRLLPAHGDRVKPLLLWMTDSRAENTNPPTPGRYSITLGSNRADAHIEAPPEHFVIQCRSAGEATVKIPVAVFAVRITGEKPFKVDHRCYVFYSAIGQREFLASVLVPHRIQVDVVARICQRQEHARLADQNRLNQHENLFRLCRENRNAIGIMEAFIVDADVGDVPGYRRIPHSIQPWGCYGSQLWQLPRNERSRLS